MTNNLLQHLAPRASYCDEFPAHDVNKWTVSPILRLLLSAWQSPLAGQMVKEIWETNFIRTIMS